MQTTLFNQCDIFCKVVDNFGDLGVCWRLATQLSQATRAEIRLWVDDIALAQRFAQLQHPDFILCHWQTDQDFTEAAPVVLETFSCGLPPRYQAHMHASTVWLNIDYLSAEAWVADFHAQASPQPNGLVRYFYYPGFTASTGGLLSGNQPPQASDMSALCQRLNIDCTQRYANYSLFCYKDAPIAALIQTLAAQPKPTQLLVPEAVMPWVCHALNRDFVKTGDPIHIGQLRLLVIPFLSQAEYDQLLRMCDINFVRGEDSWIRAIWATKPFVWMPYPQTDDAHLTKLAAFLADYTAQAPTVIQQVMQDMMLAWSGQGELQAALPAFMREQSTIQAYTQRYAKQLSEQPDLVTKLVFLIEKLQKNRV